MLDVNEPPTDLILDGSRELREDVPVGYSIGRLSVRDEDVGQSHTYEVVGLAAVAFKVDNSKRELIVFRPIYLDFESLTRDKINVTIAVTDDGSPPLTFRETFTFTVVNINEPPIGIVISGGGSIGENAMPGETVGSLSSSNDERGQSVTYRVVSVDGVANSTDFYVRTDGNATYLVCNTTLDYDNQSSFWIEIEASDNGNPPSSSIETITITVAASDPCALGTAGCSINAICTRLSSSRSRCSCVEGFGGDGTICKLIKQCSTVTPDSSDSSISLCNNGECKDHVGYYTCTCHVGYTGQDCSIAIDECASNPCGTGQCVDSVDHYTCQCDEGFTGVNCETNINDCDVSPCGNGTCVDAVNDYSCECPEGVTGDRCSFSSDDCQKESCKNSHCVPKSNDANQITIVDVDYSNGKDLPPVVLRPVTGVETPDQNSMSSGPAVCVPDDYIVKINFPAVINARSKSFLNDWERHLKNDLVVTIPARTSDGIGSVPVTISYVYITGSHLESDGSTTINFVVMVNDEAVQPHDVLIGLNKDCVNVTLLPHPDEICQSVAHALHHSPTIRPPEDPPLLISEKSSQTKRIGSHILWPIIGSVSAITIIVILALLARWYCARRRLRESRSRYDFQGGANDALDTDSIGEMYQEGVTDEATATEFHNPLLVGMKQNPIYHHQRENRGDAHCSDVGDENTVDDFVNPLYQREADAPVTLENPIYQSESIIAVGVENPIYQRSSLNAVNNPRYNSLQRDSRPSTEAAEEGVYHTIGDGDLERKSVEN